MKIRGNNSTSAVAAFWIGLLLIGVVLHVFYRIWPNVLLGLLTPCGQSVFEESKLGFWPPLFAAGLFCPRKGGKRGAGAMLTLAATLPAALLFVLWFLQIVCGICSATVVWLTWVALSTIGAAGVWLMRESKTLKRMLPWLLTVLCIWAFFYLLFSLCPLPTPLFRESGIGVFCFQP